MQSAPGSQELPAFAKVAPCEGHVECRAAEGIGRFTHFGRPRPTHPRCTWRRTCRGRPGCEGRHRARSTTRPRPPGNFITMTGTRRHHVHFQRPLTKPGLHRDHVVKRLRTVRPARWDVRWVRFARDVADHRSCSWRARGRSNGDDSLQLEGGRAALREHGCRPLAAHQMQPSCSERSLLASRHLMAFSSALASSPLM